MRDAFESRPILTGTLMVSLITLIILAIGLLIWNFALGQRPVLISSNNKSYGGHITLHPLRDLSDPHYDLFISLEDGTYTEFGRPLRLIGCSDERYICLEWPFLFAFPKRGTPSSNGWDHAGYHFEIISETKRDFCGRTRQTYLIEGSNDEGWSSRVWYRPDFGVYAVMTGQAEEGRLVEVERSYATCTQGLLNRRMVYSDRY